MGIPDITPHADLSPKKKFFEQLGDECLNVDACILLAQQIDTPQARTIYRAYRKRLATNPQGILSAEKHREQAFFDGLHDLGFQTPMIPIAGTLK